MSPSGAAWDGADLLDALRQAAVELQWGVDEVNALNVFPVPDGDTGSNMLATVHAALDEAAGLPAAGATLARVASAFSVGALMGARGNSGVILSQLFRGLAEALEDEEWLDGRGLARAMQRGRDAAFAAIARPVEGTILTVVRDAARAVGRAAESTPALEAVLSAGVEEAAAAVARTPSQLAILRRAGVVDAGGRGFELLLRGALGYARGEAPHVGAAATSDIILPALDEIEADGYGYETVFVVTPADGERLDPAAIRARLERLGESVAVAGDARAVKLHVHNERPQEVIAFGRSLGTLSGISVENLDRQSRDVRDARGGDSAGAESGRAAGVAATGTDGPAAVVVAAGPGLARLYRAIGAATVVDGGGSANLSAGELAEAIRATGRRRVVVLTNNANVTLAARQAGKLCPDVEVGIVPTRNPAEGISALVALDPSVGLADNLRRMRRALRGVQTLQVTQAVRDARIGRRKVRRGEQIVLGPSDGLLAANPDLTTAVLDAMRRLKPGFELITIYRGAGIGADAAEELRAALAAEFADVELELVDGGQPLYSVLIAAE